MKTMLKIFGSKLSFLYHTIDRLVIKGYISSLSNCNNIVYFFKEVCGIKRIDKEALGKRTKEYQKWVEAYALRNRIPSRWSDGDERKKDTLKPYREKAIKANKEGVYYILKSMELEKTFRSQKPRYDTTDPDYQIIQKTKSRFTHFYFYLVDSVLGPMVIRVASFLPFTITYYLNGHEYMAFRLNNENVSYRKKENAFLTVSNLEFLQKAADGFSYEIIKARLDYWTFVLGPKFCKSERAALNVDRFYSISQIEYCLNFIFKNNFPIRRMFERACDIGLMRLTADRIGVIFGHRITKRFKGKLQTVLERFDHGYFVFRAYFKNSFLKQYEKYLNYLRNELVCNNLSNFGLKKSLANLPAIKSKFMEILERFTDSMAFSLNNQFAIEFLDKIAAPVVVGKTRIGGIKLHDKRLLRVMGVLLHHMGNLSNWKSREIYIRVLGTSRLSQSQYSISQLRYDLRKLKAHGIIERINGSYGYRLTDYGRKVCLTFIIFSERIFGPIANGLFHFRPNPDHLPSSKIESQYLKINIEIDHLFELLSA